MVKSHASLKAEGLLIVRGCSFINKPVNYVLFLWWTKFYLLWPIFRNLWSSKTRNEKFLIIFSPIQSENEIFGSIRAPSKSWHFLHLMFPNVQNFIHSKNFLDFQEWELFVLLEPHSQYSKKVVFHLWLKLHQNKRHVFAVLRLILRPRQMQS